MSLFLAMVGEQIQVSICSAKTFFTTTTTAAATTTTT